MSNVKDASFMFCGNDLANPSSLPINIKNVTDAFGMFSYTGFSNEILNSAANSLSTAKDLSWCFSDNPSLNSLDLSNVAFDNATDLSSMFIRDKNLTNIKFKKLAGNNTTSVLSMFKNCEKLTTISTDDPSVDWNKANITGNDMFKGCINLKGGSGSSPAEGKYGVEYAKVDGWRGTAGYFTGPSEIIINGTVTCNNSPVAGLTVQMLDSLGQSTGVSAITDSDGKYSVNVVTLYGTSGSIKMGGIGTQYQILVEDNVSFSTAITKDYELLAKLNSGVRGVDSVMIYLNHHYD